MKRAAAVAAMMGLLVIPAMAQHGGAHGGFGGHAASGGFSARGGGFGGGFASHSGGFAPRGGFGSRAPGYALRSGPYGQRFTGYAPRGFMGPGRTGYAPRAGTPMYRTPYRGDWYGRGGNGYGSEGWDRHRRPYYGGFNGLNYGYPYAGYPWYPIDLDPWLFGPDDWDDSGDSDDNSAQVQDYGNVPAPYPNYGEPDYGQPYYGEPGPGYGQPAPPSQGYPPQSYPQAAPEPYQPQYPPGASSRLPYTGSSPTGESQETVTLIFKDGRPPEKIHNYMLTSSTLTVLDGNYRQIPVDQIDVAATAAANRPAGIRFQVPGANN
ncbi:MAG TPA: hypothetical protein VMD29_04525 [Terracidiphilus sp.]|nr:hypothetical protein [Terracidiphilus sp.]